METTIDLKARRAEIATAYGLECDDVRCYHCKMWGYNCGKTMNSVGESKCTIGKHKTASYQWCKHFAHNGG